MGIFIGETDVVPIRLVDDLPRICTSARAPSSTLTYYGMPLNSTNGQHQAKTISSGTTYRMFPGVFSRGFRYTGSTVVQAPIENLVSLHISPSLSGAPAFGYRSLGGTFTTRNCSYSNNMMVPYLADAGNCLHRVELVAPGVALSDGTSGYVAVIGNNVWYAGKQVYYHAFAWYLLRVYCYGSFFTPASDAIVYTIATYPYGAHDAPQTSVGYILEKVSEAGLDTYTALIKTSSTYLIDPAQPQSYQTICKNLTRIDMPRLKMQNVPDGCWVQVMGFGFYLTPGDSPDFGT